MHYLKLICISFITFTRTVHFRCLKSKQRRNHTREIKSNHLATLFIQLNSYYTYCGLIIAIENFDSLQKHAIAWFNMTHE